ncbi:MAG: O-antigen ligase family protein [Acidobacteriales bacterium]|nr:O-antigen ligase family protein [Terriglobales bacterium]
MKAASPAGPAVAVPETFPKRVWWLLAAFSVYMVLPLYDVPLLGLSLSAPVFMVIAVELFIGERAISLRPVEVWLTWAAVFWGGLFASIAGNVFQGKLPGLDLQDVETLVQYAFWLLVFVVVAAIVSRLEVISWFGRLLAVSAIVLAMVRLVTGEHFMSQNDFGCQFSTCTPLVVALLVTESGRRRFWAVGGLGLILLMVAWNASRSSWITVPSIIILFSILIGLAQPRLLGRLWPLVFLPGCVVVVLVLAPESVTENMAKRRDAMERLDKDKSFQIRLLMNQKGERLFKENPWFGAGAGRFTRASTDLDLPRELRYAREEYFNRRSPHNSYLGLLGETGLAGTVPFALLLLTLAVGGLWAAFRRARKGDVWEAALWTGFIGMSIHFWAIAGLTGTVTWFYYGLVAGSITRELRLRALIPKAK